MKTSKVIPDFETLVKDLKRYNRISNIFLAMVFAGLALATFGSFNCVDQVIPKNPIGYLLYIGAAIFFVAMGFSGWIIFGPMERTKKLLVAFYYEEMIVEGLAYPPRS